MLVETDPYKTVLMCYADNERDPKTTHELLCFIQAANAPMDIAPPEYVEAIVFARSKTKIGEL